MIEGWAEVLAFWFEEPEGVTRGSKEDNYHTKWFPPSTSGAQARTDEQIRTKFGALLHQAEEGVLAEWSIQPQSALALVLLLDQFSRHIHRQDRAAIDRNDQHALPLVEEILAQQWHQEFTSAQLIFLLMPLRHQPTAERLQQVLTIIQERLQNTRHDGELLEKFEKTSARRLQDLTGAGGPWQEGDEILEFHEFESNLEGVEKTALYQSIRAFLQSQHAEQYTHLAVSLSGGVDSMVLARYILHMREHFQHAYQLIAIHIDYGNRPESGAEADFVEDWCQRYGLLFHKRRIDEVTRGITKRDEYEKRSREIRYATYLDVMAQYPGGCPAVMFGHHRGDVQENIISNMMKGCSLLDLSGMAATGIVNGVPVWRPMLDHPKDDIFQAAHAYGIPYFLDTTPTWSTRGKMRNQLMPLLEEMYGSGYRDHLSHLADDSCQLATLTQKQWLQPFWASVHRTPLCVWVDCAPYMDQPLFFWKEALTHVCHAFVGTGLIREKAIKEILLRRFRQFSYSRPVDSFLALRKGNKTFMQSTRLVIFHTQVFPSPAHAHFKGGETLGPDQEAQWGIWHVTTRTIPAEEDSLTRKVVLEEILSGSFSYCLPLASLYEVRPKAKDLPVKAAHQVIRQALPLLALSPQATRGDDPSHVMQISIRCTWLLPSPE